MVTIIHSKLSSPGTSNTNFPQASPPASAFLMNMIGLRFFSGSEGFYLLVQGRISKCQKKHSRMSWKITSFRVCCPDSWHGYFSSLFSSICWKNNFSLGKYFLCPLKYTHFLFIERNLWFYCWEKVSWL